MTQEHQIGAQTGLKWWELQNSDLPLQKWPHSPGSRKRDFSIWSTPTTHQDPNSPTYRGLRSSGGQKKASEALKSWKTPKKWNLAVLASKTQFFPNFFWQTIQMYPTLCVTKRFQLFSTQFHEKLIGTTLPVHCEVFPNDPVPVFQVPEFPLGQNVMG